MMDSSVVDALKLATKLETDGREYYLRQAARITDRCAKELFETLAGEELKHLNMVRKQYEALTHGKGWIAFAEASAAAAVGALKPFTMLRADLKPDTSDMDALLYGIELENESFALYRGQSEQVTDPAASQMYRYLAGAERAHFDLLMLNYEHMTQTGAWLGMREGCQ